MADVRFSILFGPSSLDPTALGFPPRQRNTGVDAGDVVVPRPASSTARRRRRPDEVAGGWYAWRLMSSNNRRLASGVTSFATRLLVVDAIETVRADAERLTSVLCIDPTNGAWRWHAEIDGVAVAAGPHRYERERDCRGGFAKFAAALARAQIAESGTMLRDHRVRHTVTVSRYRPADIGRPTSWPTY